ncbi:penicillin-binding protein 1A [Thalassotalea atypica]|uniref:penicillin-binding protein 1A n=1 Tax=Thalassotalea atypica TaxID=2054316 RepID=UPI002572415A|nr:PBP1A family penicillin-binding protein [Thalassotalea atypica]
MFSLKNLVKLAVALCFLVILALSILYMGMRSELPSVESLKDLKWQTPMQIYSQDRKLISQFGEKKRIPLTLQQMPKQLINAILATEDDRFYQHFGVDPIGVGRAIIGKLLGQNKGGASTITMQVARNFFLSREVTYTRKIREVFLAFHIEYLLSKDEILALYMNKIELGHRSFGFGAAAQVYYGKDVNDLTLAQIAVLAGLPKAPSTLNPIRSPERAQSRRTVVLQRMLVSGYITQQQYDIANNAPMTGKKHGAEIELDAPYIAEMAHQMMLDKYGKEEAYTGGYKVYLSTPSHLQQAAQQAVINNLLDYDKRHGYRGPIRSIRQELREYYSSKKSSLTTDELNEAPIFEPITEQEIVETLSQVSTIQHLIPAIVTDVAEQNATIAIAADEFANIAWTGMSWAREYISDQKQGAAPKLANEILAVGDVIWVSKIDEGYQLNQLPQASAALVALSPDSGAIKAAVGGFSFKQSQFNRATQAKRQVGSNIKPFIYSAALENGYTLASLVNDAPINQWDKSSGIVWRPKNSPPEYNGPIRVKTALARSKNVVAVRLLRAVGLDGIINHLGSFGFIPDELPRNESLALGSASLTPTEVATGFATFANGGHLITPYLIERIEDSFGNLVFQAQPEYACDPCDFEYLPASPNVKGEGERLAPVDEQLITSTEDNIQESDASFLNSQQVDRLKPEIKQAPRVISAQNAFLITEGLNEAIWGADWSTSPGWQGTGFRGRKLKRRDIAGKTGTTNESKDAWFSGFSRRIVATSWIGFDDHSRNLGKTTFNRNLDKNQITGKEFGAKSAQPAWISFMRTALNDLPFEPFEPPENIVSVRIDKATGKLTTKTDRSSLFEYFQSGTVPEEYINQDESSVILDGEIEPEEEIF